MAFDFRNLQFTFRNSRRQSRRFPDCKIVNKIKHRTQSNWCVEQDYEPDKSDWDPHCCGKICTNSKPPFLLNRTFRKIPCMSTIQSVSRPKCKNQGQQTNQEEKIIHLIRLFNNFQSPSTTRRYALRNPRVCNSSVVKL